MCQALVRHQCVGGLLGKRGRSIRLRKFVGLYHRLSDTTKTNTVPSLLPVPPARRARRRRQTVDSHSKFIHCQARPRPGLGVGSVQRGREGKDLAQSVINRSLRSSSTMIHARDIQPHLHQTPRGTARPLLLVTSPGYGIVARLALHLPLPPLPQSRL